MRHLHLPPVLLAIALAGGLAGCVREPVQWDEPRAEPRGPVAQVALAPEVDSVDSVAPPLPNACPGSVRTATAGTGARYRVWWSLRADSSAALLAARSDDEGRSWTTPVPVDTLDQAVRGCNRPAPAIAADSVSGYVHVVYALWAPEGPGVFFSHSMERGALFHAPVPIIYGERPGRASIAAAGNLVAVAFEDPNSRDPKVGLALSRTMGHIFEHRLKASPSGLGALDPRVAVTAGGEIAVSWEQRTGETAAMGVSDGIRVVRRGALRPPAS